MIAETCIRERNHDLSKMKFGKNWKTATIKCIKIREFHHFIRLQSRMDEIVNEMKDKYLTDELIKFCKLLLLNITILDISSR